MAVVTRMVSLFPSAMMPVSSITVHSISIFFLESNPTGTFLGYVFGFQTGFLPFLLCEANITEQEFNNALKAKGKKVKTREKKYLAKSKKWGAKLGHEISKHTFHAGYARHDF
jgi:hypothetical protein